MGNPFNLNLANGLNFRGVNIGGGKVFPLPPGVGVGPIGPRARDTYGPAVRIPITRNIGITGQFGMNTSRNFAGLGGFHIKF